MIILILIFGLIFRLISLNQSFWLDEATSATVVRNLDFSGIITKFAPHDFHPPFYYLVLKVWTQIFGLNEISTRMLSVLLGVATIYVVYLIGKRLFNGRVGIIAAVFLSTSGLHIYYSQEARMYAVAAFFTSLAFYLFTRVEQGRLRDWILFSFVLPLLFLTDYLPITVLAVFGIWGFFFHKNSSWWKRFLASLIPLTITITVWLPTFLKQFSGGLSIRSSNWWNILGRTTFKEILLIPAKFIIGRVSIENPAAYPLLLAILFLIFGSLIFVAARNIKKENTALTVLWLFLPVILTIFIGLGISVLLYFRLLFVLPAFYLLVAEGVSQIDKKRQGIILALILAVNLISTGVYLFNPRFHREDWRGLVSLIERKRTKTSQVLFPANSQMEAYRYYAPQAIILGPEGFSPKANEIWLMRYVQDIFDPEDKLRTKIDNSGFKRVEEYNFNGVVVWRYEK